jgi:hypothetical protein
MIPLKIEATIQAGKLCPTPNGVELLKSWLAANDGASVELLLRAPNEAKTNQQLRYMWGHVIPAIATRTGYSKDEVYGWLKYKYLRRQIDYRNEDGEPVYIVASLTELTKAEVAKFIDDSVSYGLYLGADICPPENYGGNDGSE